ncbi:MAG TPA: bifunctional precorrin-2 dehydrogenase/sirohydrochlorin ferrochelatase [Acidimicrobiales bacterium]|nr:bifunctional precorrin-2 dehydrogenase/sirohydrochlorin ferrochelatase [Acidimicrobiales bacterium]
MLPITLELRGQPAVVFGAGEVGCRRAAQLVAEGARVRLIATEIRATPPAGLDDLLNRPYRRGDLAGFAIAVAAIGDDEVNDAIYAEATETSTLLNVVDDPIRSSFYFPAVHRAGEVTVAVSTEGAAPALAAFLRNRIAATLPSNLAEVSATLRAERRSFHERGISTELIDWSERIDALLGAHRD